MATKKDCESFLGKKAKVMTNIGNGFVYRGVVVDVSDNMLEVDDIYDGRIKIALFSIVTIQNMKNGK